MHKRELAGAGDRVWSPRTDEDSQGKNRGLFTKRTGLLGLAFTIGLTIGVVMSQRVYIESNREAVPMKVKQAKVSTQSGISPAAHPTIAPMRTTVPWLAGQHEPALAGARAQRGRL